MEFFIFKMGRYARSRTHKGRKGFSRSCRTASRARDIDQVQDDLKRVASGKTYAVLPPGKCESEELPAGGAHPCIPCAQYFIDEHALGEHKRGKGHKKRLKLLKEEPYTVKEAEAAAGLGSYNHPKSKK